MKQAVILACALSLLLLTACAGGQAQSSQSTQEKPAESSASSSSVAPEVAEQMNLLEPAEGPVPEFLDAEQQQLYRQAKTAFWEFTLNNDGFGSTAPAELGVEVDGLTYYPCDGSITSWADFESSMLSVFTQDYFTQLNNGASYTDEAGKEHIRTTFMEMDGKLYFICAARGANSRFIEPETFELISESDTEIKFNVVGQYRDISYTDGVESVADTPTTEKKPLTMVKGPDGWRFSEFSLAY